MEDHLAELLEAVERSPADLEARTEEQLLSLQRELLQTRDLVNAIELELAEEATQYRYPRALERVQAGRLSAWDGMPTRVRSRRRIASADHLASRSARVT